jgi:putative acetyltransferase
VTVRIRDATDQDRPALLALWEAAWTAAMPAIDFQARLAWFEQHLDHLQAAGAQLLVADIDGTLVGFTTVDTATQIVDQLAVAPASQGRGVGRLLLEAAKSISPEGLCLSVNRDNPQAIGFYNSAGFVMTGEGTNVRSGLPVQHMIWRPDRRKESDAGQRHPARG